MEVDLFPRIETTGRLAPEHIHASKNRGHDPEACFATIPERKTAHIFGSIALAAFFAAITFAGECLAASSDWLETTGGRVRLVTSGALEKDGTLHGALEIDLLEGWKTYWRDPGAAGVPPELDISGSTNIASVELSFPAPELFDDGGTKWAGYRHSVAFPATFTLKAPDSPARIEASVFLGICKTICIPVQGQLSVDPTWISNDPADSAVVEMARAALPSPARPGFSLFWPQLEMDRLTVEAVLPGHARHADLFIAGAHGFMFGAVASREENGRIFFTVPVVEWPEDVPETMIFHYTLATDAGVVNGALQVP